MFLLDGIDRIFAENARNAENIEKNIDENGKMEL